MHGRLACLAAETGKVRNGATVGEGDVHPLAIYTGDASRKVRRFTTRQT